MAQKNPKPAAPEAPQPNEEPAVTVSKAPFERAVAMMLECLRLSHPSVAATAEELLRASVKR